MFRLAVEVVHLTDFENEPDTRFTDDIHFLSMCVLLPNDTIPDGYVCVTDEVFTTTLNPFMNEWEHTVQNDWIRYNAYLDHCIYGI